MKTNYAGIDYGNGKTNIREETGIRFGVISQYAILQAWSDSSEPYYGHPTDVECPKCETEVKAENWGDYVTCNACGCKFEAELPDFAEPLSYSYEDEDEGYVMETCLDTDVMILRSPYFTYAQFCSPCVPGACNLDSPLDRIEANNKCYCVGHDWFDGGKAPYTIYSVETGLEVKP